MKALICLAGLLVLVGCKTDEGTVVPDKLNIAAAAPVVPADIRARYQYQVPAPVGTSASPAQTYKVIRDLHLSETEKTLFLGRLIRIIDGFNTNVASTVSSKELKKKLQQVQQKSAQNQGATP